MNIEFTRPLILLAIPACIALLVFSVRFLSIRSKAQKISYVVVRALLASLLILALSGVNVKFKDKYTATVFLLDASDSVKNSRSEMISFINDAIKEKSKHDSVAVVAFGDGSAVEQFISLTPIFSEIQTNVVTSATNLENAVTTGLALIPEGYAGRIVLLTDGVENTGSIKNSIASVVAGKAHVEVKSYETGNSAEVYVSNLIVPKNVGTGENFAITVEIESNIATEATIHLISGKTEKGVKTTKLQPGTNTLLFSDTQTEEGIKTYRVYIDCENDTFKVNNEYLAYTDISVNKPILVVEGSKGEADEFRKLVDSLGLEYEVMLPLTVPKTVSELNNYSSVVFVDVYADDLRDGFLDILETYVKDFAGGFIATGGKNAFALGNYKDTAIETVLPVSMELQGENEIPSMAIMMVIDHSGSMSDGNSVTTNLDLAKEAAIAAVKNLRPSDSVGVIAFDDHYSHVVKLGAVGNGSAAINGISGIQIGGGTSILPALVAAVSEIEKSPAMIKHIILLTDGEDGYDYINYHQTLETMNKSDITLSTLSIGEFCNSPLLEMLAERGNGRYYHTDINTDVPRIFAQEIFLSVNSYLVNRDFTPIIAAPRDELISNVIEKGLPQLKGYIATTAKPRATQLLVSDTGDPVLCTWQYGLGKTVAWTTDVNGKWSANYSGWEKYQELWHNLLNYVTTRFNNDRAYADVKQEGSRAIIEYVTKDSSSATSVTAIVADDNGNTTELNLDPVSPGKYTASFDMSGTGVYSIHINQFDKGEITGSLNTATIMQYSLEYRFYDKSTALDEFVKAVGGKMITEAKEVFDESLDLVKRQNDISTPLLIIAILLFMFDIFIRRFRIDIPGRLQALSSRLRPKPALADGVMPGDKKAKSGAKKAVKSPVAEATASDSNSDASEPVPEAEKPKKTKEKKNKKDDKKQDPPKPSGPERLNTAELMKTLRR